MRCRYYKPEMDVLKGLCNDLYKLPDCGAGGMLHIMLDDNNVRLEDVAYCLRECLLHPEEPEAEIGINICHEYLKMTFTERMIFDWYWMGSDLQCCGNCEECEYLKEW